VWLEELGKLKKFIGDYETSVGNTEPVTLELLLAMQNS
jgi:hypothetical protein